MRERGNTMMEALFGIVIPPTADAATVVGIIVIKLAIGSIAGWVAFKKGYSFAVFTVVGFFWFIAALAIALYLPKREGVAGHTRG